MTPGKKVICVDSSIKPEMFIFVLLHMPNWVKQQKKYTVREFDDNDGIADGILLEEVVNPPIFVELVGKTIEPRFATWRFREVAEDEVAEEVEEGVEELVEIDRVPAGEPWKAF